MSIMVVFRIYSNKDVQYNQNKNQFLLYRKVLLLNVVKTLICFCILNVLYIYIYILSLLLFINVNIYNYSGIFNKNNLLYI